MSRCGEQLQLFTRRFLPGALQSLLLLQGEMLKRLCTRSANEGSEKPRVDCGVRKRSEQNGSKGVMRGQEEETRYYPQSGRAHPKQLVEDLKGKKL